MQQEAYICIPMVSYFFFLPLSPGRSLGKGGKSGDRPPASTAEVPSPPPAALRGLEVKGFLCKWV